MVAICESDGDALVETFRFPGKEFCCVTCGALYGWFDAPSTEWTAELEDRLIEARAEFDHRYGRVAS